MEITKPELYTVIGALVTVITFFWGILWSWIKTNNTRLRSHEMKQADDNQEIRRLTGEINYLKGQMDGVSNLSRSVLDEISKLKIRDPC